MSPEEKIRRSLESGNISHAYIFEGSSLSGKESAARMFLGALSGETDLELCPDYYEVRAAADKGRTVSSIKDKDMEELQAGLKMKPQSDRNLALIYDADSMTIRAQNRFLKTLEEPTQGTVIILLSENTENLLETIRSRCVIYRFYDNDSPEYDSDDHSELIFKILSDDSFHEIKKSISRDIRSREDAYRFLDMLEKCCGDIMTGRDKAHLNITKDRAINAIEETEDTRKALNGNAIYSYAIKHLALKLQEN